MRPKEKEIKKAISILRKAIQEDGDYALSWHNDIAGAMQRSGVKRSIADKGTAKFMENMFGAHISRRTIIPVGPTPMLVRPNHNRHR